MIQTGDTIGPYTLLRPLGRGAFGEVWLAERVTSLLTTLVALKLPLDTATDLDVIRQEAHVWLKASGHPNIVPVLEAEVYNGQVVIASEYISGGSLAEWPPSLYRDLCRQRPDGFWREAGVAAPFTARA